MVCIYAIIETQWISKTTHLRLGAYRNRDWIELLCIRRFRDTPWDRHNGIHCQRSKFHARGLGQNGGKLESIRIIDMDDILTWTTRFLQVLKYPSPNSVMMLSKTFSELFGLLVIILYQVWNDTRSLQAFLIVDRMYTVLQPYIIPREQSFQGFIFRPQRFQFT